MTKFYNKGFFFTICISLENAFVTTDQWPHELPLQLLVFEKVKPRSAEELGWVKNHFLKLHIAWEYKRPHEFPLTKLSEDHSLIGAEHSLIVEAPFWNTLASESPIFRFVYSEGILRTSCCQGRLNKRPCHSVSHLWIDKPFNFRSSVHLRNVQETSDLLEQCDEDSAKTRTKTRTYTNTRRWKCIWILIYFDAFFLQWQ